MFLTKIDVATASTALGARRKYQGELGGPESLFQYLCRTAVVLSSLERQQATNDKDRVYTLLGISKNVLNLRILARPVPAEGSVVYSVYC
jgi:hypothetical protein